MGSHWKNAFLLLVALGSSPCLRADDAYRIIVNARNPIGDLDRQFVADSYLKKIKHWPEDGVIQPVDLRSDSATRKFFSEDVLARSVMGVKSYWQQLIFSGADVPPPELKSDAEVIHFVGNHPEAIGYVSAGSLAGAAGVKAIGVR